MNTVTEKAADVIFPPACAFCGKVMPRNSLGLYVCNDCLKAVKFCRDEDKQKSRSKAEAEYILAHLRYRCDDMTSVCIYDKNSSYGIVRFKTGNSLGNARVFASLIKETMPKRFKNQNFSLAVSVPPHKKRIFMTGYDQGRTLAKLTAERLGIKYMPNVLSRTRKTAKQTTLSEAERAENMKNAFKVCLPERDVNEYIKDKTILVIDDVITTGATVNACAAALKSAGAKAVFAASIARSQRSD